MQKVSFTASEKEAEIYPGKYSKMYNERERERKKMFKQSRGFFSLFKH